jgi:protocatechuate 3,4-dioxygenase beta subunit
MLSTLVLHTAALILLVQSSAAPTSRASEKVAPKCIVSGRVVTAADGTPLKSSRVALMLEHQGREPQAYAAMSGTDGRFTIKDVPAGRYRFIANHTGYVQQEYQSTGGDVGAVLALQAGQEVGDIVFRMTLASVVTGRVNDEDGDPMSLIQVVVLRKPGDEELEEEEGRFHSRHAELVPAGFAQTDDRGQYRAFGLKAGEYYIKAIDEYQQMGGPVNDNDWTLRQVLGSQYAPVFYPGVTQLGQAQVVAVSPGEETQVDLIMRHIKTAQVSGHLIGADGKPATDAYLYLQEVPAANYGGVNGVGTDAKGEFKLNGVAPGSYVLHAVQNSSLDNTSYHASQKVEVGSDNVDSIVLALGRGITFTGRVEVAGPGTMPLERIFINLSSHDDESANAWAQIKKDGTFVIRDVPDGSFAFLINGLEEGWYVKSVRLGAEDILTNGLEVEKGESAGTIQVIVSNDAAQLDGLVTQDDKPLIGARVRITPDPETPFNRSRLRSGNTDQGGRFSFMGIAPGRYSVIARASTSDGEKPAASDPETVTLSGHDRKTIALKVISTQMQ